MLNQERVCEMTRLAVFDQREGQECKPMIQFFRSDYIAKEMIKSLITGTLAFCMLAGAAVLYYTEQLMEQINSMDLKQAAVRVLICYALFMLVYFAVTYVVYYRRYTKGRQKIKKYYLHLKKVNGIYREEEQI